MTLRGTVLVIAAGLALAPCGFSQQPKKKASTPKQDEGVAQAIAFERAKDAADARQARIEARHPTVQEPGEANRSTESQAGRPVTDHGPQPANAPDHQQDRQ